jgi:hypothetical protein
MGAAIHGGPNYAQWCAAAVVDLRGSSTLPNGAWENLFVRSVRTFADSGEYACVAEGVGIKNRDQAYLPFWTSRLEFDVESAVGAAFRFARRWDDERPLARELGDDQHRGITVVLDICRWLPENADCPQRLEATDASDIFERSLKDLLRDDPKDHTIVIATGRIVGRSIILPLEDFAPLGFHQDRTGEKIPLYIARDVRAACNKALEKRSMSLRRGLVDVLMDGLCPGGDVNYLRWQIRHARMIRILQTYIPYLDRLQDDFVHAVCENDARVEVILLRPYWTKAHYAGIHTNIKVVGDEAPSPLAFQRGEDFGYDRSSGQRFEGQIQACLNQLRQINGLCKRAKKGSLEWRFYDATPSLCLHIFDHMMFAGSFLRGDFAVRSPHLLLVRQADSLFSAYEKEFTALWAASTSDHLR